MLVAGCLFPEPPEYRREKTPPFLWGPNPTTTKVLRVKSYEPVGLNVKVKSEDDGEDLRVLLYLNYLIPGAQALQTGFEDIPAATLQDEDRPIRFDWTVPYRQTPGTCEQLSLLVAHESTFTEDHLPAPGSETDLAIMTWWVSINETEESFVDCPKGMGEIP